MNDVIPLLKHSPSAQALEVLEEITVQREPIVARLVEVAIDVEGGPRHQLLVGPRGIGKTHLLTLIAGRLKTQAGGRKIVVAWLPEDPWSIRSYEKFLAEVLRQVATDLDDPALAGKAEQLRPGEEGVAMMGEQLLRDAVGDARLILLVENLHEIFSRIGEEGQARLRALAEDWRQLLIFATVPQLFEGVQLHESPFYGFFAVTHLDELSLASAQELMRRIAERRGDAELAEFLRTDMAARRLAAIEALAGGHPRVWLLLSGCISIRAIDDLVPLFLEALDNLTPYYQDRLRELTYQQQEIIVLLGEAGGAQSNRDLADRTGLPQNQIATLVRQLDRRGYIRRARVSEEIASGDDRMSYWELREPLMRLCLDVKQSRGEPLRTVVEFLRAWYGPKLLDELMALPESAQLAASYVTEALRTFDDSFPADDLFKGTPREILERADRGLSLLPDCNDLRIARFTGLLLNSQLAEAEKEYETLIATELSEGVKLALRLQLMFAREEAGEAIDADDLARQLLDLYATSPKDPQVLSMTVQGLINLEHYEQALEIFPAAIEAMPDDRDLAMAFAASLIETDRNEEAADAFSRAIELDPTEVSAYGGRGVALRRLGRFEEALKVFSEAAKFAPEDPRPFTSAGFVLNQLNRPDEALVALDKSLSLGSDSPDIHSARSIALRRLGRYEEALEAATTATDLAPETALFHERVGTLMNELGRYEEAVEAFDRSKELDPGRSQTAAGLGMALVNLGHKEEALRAFEKAHELDPSSSVVHSNVGGMLVQLGRNEEAVKTLTAAAEAHPDTGSIWNNLGGALGNLGRVEEALEAFEQAIELNPKDPEIRFNRGLAHSTLGRAEEAVEDFSTAAELAPENPTFHAHLGAAVGNLGRNEEALAAFQRAHEIAPENSEFLRLIGIALHAQGRDEEALNVLTEAAERAPERAILHNHRANILREMGRLEEAEAAAAAAVTNDEREPAYRFTHAEVALEAGDDEQAVARLRDALRLWRESGQSKPGEPDLLARILWRRFQTDPAFGSVIAEIIHVYAEVEADDELGSGLVLTIPRAMDSEISQARAEAWLATWKEAGSGVDGLSIPLAILAAATAWKQDHDRSHLLALPQEQRTILSGLLADASDGP